MDRETGRVVLIALLCCLAVVLAAATLPSMVENGGGGGFGGADGGGSAVDEPDESSETDSGSGSAIQYSLPEPCVGFLDSKLGLLGLVLGTVGIAAVATRSYDVRMTILLSVALLPLVVLAFAVLTSGCGTQPIDPPTSPGELSPTAAENGSGGPFGGDGDSTVPGPTLPSLLVLTVLLITIVGGFAALYYTGSESRGSAESSAEPDDTVQRSALGRAAGQAADRIESGDDFENDVYRAWREMTEPLEVDRPASSTPGEFAAAARDAGLDPSQVEELRTMFEDVRYGDRPITDDRERRAVEILRRIEATYGDDDRARSNGDAP